MFSVLMAVNGQFVRQIEVAFVYSQGVKIMLVLQERMYPIWTQYQKCPMVKMCMKMDTLPQQ